MPSGRTGGGIGWIGLYLGSCGLWQWAHRRYSFFPFHSPVRFPWTPTFQSRNLSPWHCPHSRYDSEKSIFSPETSRSLSRLAVSWQSRHQRCPWAWFRTMPVCSSLRTLRVGFGLISLWHSEQGKIPGVNGGGGTGNCNAAGSSFRVLRPSASKPRAFRMAAAASPEIVFSFRIRRVSRSNICILASLEAVETAGNFPSSSSFREITRMSCACFSSRTARSSNTCLAKASELLAAAAAKNRFPCFSNRSARVRAPEEFFFHFEDAEFAIALPPPSNSINSPDYYAHGPSPFSTRKKIYSFFFGRDPTGGPDPVCDHLFISSAAHLRQ